METESATPITGAGGEERSQSVVKGDEVKDNRKCLLCPVEGDAECMVRWLHLWVIRMQEARWLLPYNYVYILYHYWAKRENPPPFSKIIKWPISMIFPTEL